jgi:hypothetical protein
LAVLVAKSQRSELQFSGGTNTACGNKRRDSLVRIEKPGYTGRNVEPATPVAAPAAGAAHEDPDAEVDAGAAGNDPIGCGDATTVADPLPLSA